MKRTFIFAALAAVAASASAAELWNNGPLATGANHSTLGTAAPGGGQWSELQVIGGVSQNILGFGLAGGNRLADDFTVGAGGWAVTSFSFHAYLTNATAPSATAATLRLWDGRPGDAGSNIIFGDTTTNLLTSTTMSNIYRTSSTAANTARQLQLLTLSLNVNLAAGTYWADWDATGVSFSPAVTLVGQSGKPGANGRQLNTTPAWVDLIDTGATATQTWAQDANFSVNGSVVPEPATMAALGLGFAAILRRRRSKKA